MSALLGRDFGARPVAGGARFFVDVGQRRAGGRQNAAPLWDSTLFDVRDL
jgi:hypothetical protein